MRLDSRAPRQVFDAVQDGPRRPLWGHDVVSQTIQPCATIDVQPVPGGDFTLASRMESPRVGGIPHPWTPSVLSLSVLAAPDLMLSDVVRWSECNH
jgi:hypothetical protein